MKRLIMCAVLAMTLSGYDEPQEQLMCFKTGEERSGLNKICYYSCAGSRAAITVKSYKLCPLTIDR